MYFGHGTYSPSDLDLIKIQKTKNGETKEYYRVYDINSSEINIEVSIETAEIDVVDSVPTDNIADWSEKKEQIYEDMNFIKIDDTGDDDNTDNIIISKLPICEGDARKVALKTYRERYSLTEMINADLYSEKVVDDTNGKEYWSIWYLDDGEINENIIKVDIPTGYITNIGSTEISRSEAIELYNGYNITISGTNEIMYLYAPLDEMEAKNVCKLMNLRYGYEFSDDEILCYETTKTVDLVEHECFLTIAPESIYSSFYIDKNTGYICPYPGGVDFYDHEYIGYHVAQGEPDLRIYINNLPLSETDARKIAKMEYKNKYFTSKNS